MNSKGGRVFMDVAYRTTNDSVYVSVFSQVVSGILSRKNECEFIFSAFYKWIATGQLASCSKKGLWVYKVGLDRNSLDESESGDESPHSKF